MACVLACVPACSPTRAERAAPSSAEPLPLDPAVVEAAAVIDRAVAEYRRVTGDTLQVDVVSYRREAFQHEVHLELANGWFGGGGRIHVDSTGTAMVRELYE